MDVEDGQLFLAQVFAHVPPLLLGQHARQRSMPRKPANSSDSR
ncbi:MAG TPA: hypothetical protein VGP97_20865 [Burkholderiales bacterium]|jgi:hypothetical protein|nr:hypothetical protein [Burkholderiales bacterium]